MKILLTLNKTYRGQIDVGYWYTYLPLQQLGHDVHLYDTANPHERDYEKVIEAFKPDLIFCCMTGDRTITPSEPWERIAQETHSGRTKTFNWFCDDTWRFETFSSKACHYFNACSTPEPTCLEKFKNIGYNNIILGCWHANAELYSPRIFDERDLQIAFVGAPTPTRKRFFENSDVPIEWVSGVSQDELFETYNRSKIGLNLSNNDNDPTGKTQMKLRPFEIAAGAGLVLTQHHNGMEEFFEIDKEIITFSSQEEFDHKATFLIENPHIAKVIAAASYQRFLAEHESKVRLTKILEQIKEL